MKRLLIAALVTTLIGAPIANARDQHDRYGYGNRHQPKYPKGWGPHRGPDRAGYYRGYRGYRDHQRGYRRHSDGLWYPAAAFALGAIIGGTLVR